MEQRINVDSICKWGVGAVHFFYLDETGCSGADLNPGQEPVFVIGGLSVRDEGWLQTTQAFEKVLSDYFGLESLPVNFELHAHELLSPNGDSFFLGRDREGRNMLALSLLDVLATRAHEVHYWAVDKVRLAEESNGDESNVYNPRIPYLLGYDYLVTYTNNLVKERLGRSARGMIILDIKPQFDQPIRTITHYRRFEVAKAHRLKWLVEFSYPIDSRRHPMIQFSDLIMFCTRKFFELDNGYRNNWPIEAKRFYTQCFSKIYPRLSHKTLVEQGGQNAINELIRRTWLKPSKGWKNKYP